MLCYDICKSNSSFVLLLNSPVSSRPGYLSVMSSPNLIIEMMFHNILNNCLDSEKTIRKKGYWINIIHQWMILTAFSIVQAAQFSKHQALGFYL